MWYIQDKIHPGKVVKYWNLRIMRLRMRTTIFLKFSYLQEMQYIILCNIFLNLSLAYILLELSIFSTDAMNKCDNFPQSRIPESRPFWRPKWALSPAQILSNPSIPYLPCPNECLCQVSECDHNLNDLLKIDVLAALLYPWKYLPL